VSWYTRIATITKQNKNKKVMNGLTIQDNQGTDACFLPPIPQENKMHISHTHNLKRKSRKGFSSKKYSPSICFSALKQRSVCEQQHLLNETFLVIKLQAGGGEMLPPVLILI
jgi:hypothetical protein